MLENVIIIPYRKREKHLEYYINNTVPLIKQHLPHTKVVVVEQANDKLFNRGKLLNVGFMEYKDKTKYFITQDVDMIPNVEIIKKIYSKNDVDVCQIKFVHDMSLGGIVKIKHDITFDINGFPNDIWGWGIEDRALFFRCFMKNIAITKNNNQSFKMLPHSSNSKPPTNEKKQISDMWMPKYINTLNEKQKEQMIMGSGLNTLEYAIVERKNMYDMIELIKVDI